MDSPWAPAIYSHVYNFYFEFYRKYHRLPGFIETMDELGFNPAIDKPEILMQIGAISLIAARDWNNMHEKTPQP